MNLSRINTGNDIIVSCNEFHNIDPSNFSGTSAGNIWFKATFFTTTVATTVYKLEYIRGFLITPVF